MQPECPKCSARLEWSGHQTIDEFSVWDGDMIPKRTVRDGLEWWCEECERFYRPSEVERSPAEKADEVETARVMDDSRVND